MKRYQVLVFTPYSISKIDNAPTVRAWSMYKSLKGKVDTQLICGSFFKRMFREIVYLLRRKSPACVYIEALASKMFLPDYFFLGILRRRGSKIYPYIRDVYWKFPHFLKMGVRRRIWNRYCRREMDWYNKNAQVLFFPSSSLADIVDFPRKELLPPGGDALRCGEVKLPLNKHIVYVGGIEKRMGPAILAGAMERVVDVYPDARCSIIGRGDLKLLDRWRSCKWISIYSLPYSEISGVLADAYVCVIPLEVAPYNDLTLPVKLFDYMSSGKPIVVTDCKEMADFVKNNKIGVVTEDNPDSLARGILRLLEDRSFAEECGRNALSLIHSEHSWDHRAEKLLEVINRFDAG